MDLCEDEKDFEHRRTNMREIMNEVLGLENSTRIIPWTSRNLPIADNTIANLSEALDAVGSLQLARPPCQMGNHIQTSRAPDQSTTFKLAVALISRQETWTITVAMLGRDPTNRFQIHSESFDSLEAAGVIVGRDLDFAGGQQAVAMANWLIENPRYLESVPEELRSTCFVVWCQTGSWTNISSWTGAANNPGTIGGGLVSLVGVSCRGGSASRCWCSRGRGLLDLQKKQDYCDWRTYEGKLNVAFAATNGLTVVERFRQAVTRFI